ncbi:MAG: 3-deoxy-manno-octulosonate cytidylyltransferase [Endomicrobium sp.]|jgi:3-deoxy-manno-octulosonate cytidylyltransferase (CMP-KDO synthetase)|nr:3-deoxy-manno-octulosonate cytidylyltransferase [Endomicrobium sp.]
MKITAIIPARYTSSRFLGKPLALINGKPLIQHTLERIKKCKKIDFITVVTDNKLIYNFVKKLNFKIFMTKKNCKSGTDRIAFAASKYLKNCDLFINVQCDEPLIDPKLVDTLVDLLKKNKSLECATAAFPIYDKDVIENPNVVKVVFNKYRYALYFSRYAIPYNRDNIKTQYYKHIGVYGYRREFLIQFSRTKMLCLEKTENLEQLRILETGKKIKVIISKYDSIGVDTPDDIINVEKYLSKY